MIYNRVKSESNRIWIKKTVWIKIIWKKYLFCDIYLFTSFAVSALISFTAWANSWCSTKSTVHALWITKCRLTILSHVTFRALTDFILIAPAAVGALFIAFRIRSFILKTRKNSRKWKMAISLNDVDLQKDSHNNFPILMKKRNLVVNIKKKFWEKTSVGKYALNSCILDFNILDKKNVIELVLSLNFAIHCWTF